MHGCNIKTGQFATPLQTGIFAVSASPLPGAEKLSMQFTVNQIGSLRRKMTSIDDGHVGI